MQSPVELHSRPNVSTLQCSVFIRGDGVKTLGYMTHIHFNKTGVANTTVQRMNNTSWFTDKSNTASNYYTLVIQL